MKGKFRIKGIKSTNPIAVGDIVDYELEESSDTVTETVPNIHERKNYIARLFKDIHQESIGHQEKILNS